jgi:hypothetical protein
VEGVDRLYGFTDTVFSAMIFPFKIEIMPSLQGSHVAIK